MTMVLFNKDSTRETRDTMTDIQKQTRTGRFPAGDTAKKIVSLTLDPALIAKIDEYAAEKKISRSAAIETAITGLFAVRPTTSQPTMVENSLVQSDDCIFASPQLGAAIFY